MRLPVEAARAPLVLDLGTCTGWCAGGFDAAPRHGTITLVGQRPVHRCAALRDWLDDFCQVYFRPTALILEAAIVAQKNSLVATEILFSLRATALLWAYDAEAEGPPIWTDSVASTTVRAHMLGTSRFPKGEVKDHVAAWCRRNGIAPATDDAADAVLTWHYLKAMARGTPKAPPGMLAA